MHRFYSHMSIFIFPSFVKAQNIGERCGFSEKRMQILIYSSLLKTYYDIENCPKQNVVIHWTISIHHIVLNIKYA